MSDDQCEFVPDLANYSRLLFPKETKSVGGK